jgi:hypothetical protein
MSRGGSVKSLEAAVRRLEKAAGRGPRYCAFCRYARPASPRPNTPEEEVLNRKCEFCYSEYALHLSLPGEDTEVLRMFFSHTLEDRYTDPKAHAITLWWVFKPERVEKAERLAAPKEKAKRDPLARAGARLSEEVDWLIARRQNKLEAKYGEPFPEHYQLIETVRNRERRKTYAPGLAALEREETQHLIRAELEKIVWGEVRAETASAINRIGVEIDELVREFQEEEISRRQKSGPSISELLNRHRAQRGLPPLPDGRKE